MKRALAIGAAVLTAAAGLIAWTTHRALRLHHNPPGAPDPASESESESESDEHGQPLGPE